MSDEDLESEKPPEWKKDDGEGFLSRVSFDMRRRTLKADALLEALEEEAKKNPGGMKPKPGTGGLVSAVAGGHRSPGLTVWKKAKSGGFER